MGKQINFYMDRETEESFIFFIKEKGGVFIFYQDFRLYFDKSIKEMRDENGSFSTYIYKESFGDIVLEHGVNFKNQPYEALDLIKSPIINFDSSVICIANERASRGRVYITTFYFDENENKVQKSKVLEDFYKDLVKWIKKNVSYQNVNLNGFERKEYISNIILQLIFENKIKRLI